MNVADGARCALHFDTPSIATCRRCGKFCCEHCLGETRPPLCGACAPALIDPYGLTQQGLDLVPAVVGAFKLIADELPRLVTLVVVFSLPMALFRLGLSGATFPGLFGSSFILSVLYTATFGLLGSQAMLALLIARSQGRTLTLGGALHEAMQNWGHAFGVRLRAGLVIMLFALGLGVPGVWKAIRMMFSGVASLRSQERDALEASERLVTGRFLGTFGFAFALLIICWVPLSAASTVVGVAAAELSLPRFFLELCSDLVGRFFIDGVANALLLVGYVMLSTTAGLPLAPMQWRREPALTTTLG